MHGADNCGVCLCVPVCTRVSMEKNVPVPTSVCTYAEEG